MNHSPLYLGIDFGTTNCSVACVYGDPRHLRAQTIPVHVLDITMDGEQHLTAHRMPTLLSTRFDDRRAGGLAKGWEFFNIFGKKKKTPLLRQGRELFESVKSDLGSYKVYPYAAASECRTPRKVAENIFRTLLGEARTRLPGFAAGEARTVITVPASLNAEARRETRAAAVDAGLNDQLIELIDEPIAALLHLLNEQSASAVLSIGEPRNVLVFDYGGGTLDLCLVKCVFCPDAQSGLIAENLAISQYRRNGGNDVDRAIMDQVIWPQIASQLDGQRHELDADLKRAIEDTLTCTVARKLKERLCQKITAALQGGEDYSKLGSNLSETVKLEGNFIDDRLPRPIKGRFKITKSDFDRVMQPFLEIPNHPEEMRHADFTHSLLVPIWDCLQKAGLAPEDLDVLVLHGGSCRNPYVRSHLKEVFNDEQSLFSRTVIVTTPDLDTSVACGAALACYWKHERNVELIKPVTAEDIGVLTLGDRPVCLVESGTPLPFPEEGVHALDADFYVPQPNQKELIVPFYAGATERHPRLSGSVKVPLPSEVRQGDLIKLKVCVDRNKILHWWYRVGNGVYKEATPFNDPWTPRQLDPDERELMAFRKRMTDYLAKEKPMPKWMLIEEATHLRAVAHYREAEIALRDYIREYGLDGQNANLLALVCGAQNRIPEELHYSEKAAALAPHNAIFAGNHGCNLITAGQVDLGIASIRNALAKDPNLAYLYEWLGDAYRRKGDEVAALREYRQCLKLAEREVMGGKGSSESWSNLARVQQKVGDYEQAGQARTHAREAHLNALYQGDHRQRIAGPDSGFWVDNVRGVP